MLNVGWYDNTDVTWSVATQELLSYIQRNLLLKTIRSAYNSWLNFLKLDFFTKRAECWVCHQTGQSHYTN